MLYIVNTDEPGFIGKLGTTLGEAGLNIATFNLGRRAAGGEAVALVAIDEEVPEAPWSQTCAPCPASARSCRWVFDWECPLATHCGHQRWTHIAIQWSRSWG